MNWSNPKYNARGVDLFLGQSPKHGHFFPNLPQPKKMIHLTIWWLIIIRNDSNSWGRWLTRKCTRACNINRACVIFVVHFCRGDFKFISLSSVGLELWDWIDIRLRIKIDKEIFLDGDFACGLCHILYRISYSQNIKDCEGQILKYYQLIGYRLIPPIKNQLFHLNLGGNLS